MYGNQTVLKIDKMHARCNGDVYERVVKLRNDFALKLSNLVAVLVLVSRSNSICILSIMTLQLLK